MAVQQTNVSARRTTANWQWSVWQHIGAVIAAHSNMATPASQPMCHLRDVGGVAGGVGLLLQLGHTLLLAADRCPQRLQLALHTVNTIASVPDQNLTWPIPWQQRPVQAVRSQHNSKAWGDGTRQRTAMLQAYATGKHE
jgi:hypothetical protein